MTLRVSERPQVYLEEPLLNQELHTNGRKSAWIDHTLWERTAKIATTQAGYSKLHRIVLYFSCESTLRI